MTNAIVLIEHEEFGVPFVSKTMRFYIVLWGSGRGELKQDIAGPSECAGRLVGGCSREKNQNP